MRCLIKGEHYDNAYVFYKNALKNNTTLREYCADNVLYYGTLFGWDIAFDTRNLEYYPKYEDCCITEFYLTSDGEKKNIFFKNLGDNVPKMDKIAVVDFNDKNDLLKFMGEEKLEYDGKLPMLILAKNPLVLYLSLKILRTR